MLSINLTAEPSESGQSFKVTINKAHTITCQGDMVLERMVDVLNPFLRRLANELDTELRKQRKGGS